MEIICYALSAAVLVLTGAVISGGVTLHTRCPRKSSAASPSDPTHCRDSAALMAYGREEDEDNAV